MATDADFSLDDLKEQGIRPLKNEGAEPGVTYEVGPGLVGEMQWPTLQIREDYREIGDDVGSFFRDDATPEDFRYWKLLDVGVNFNSLPDSAEELPEGALDHLPDESPIEALEQLAESASHPAREGVTAADFTQTTARVNCERAALVLDFDKEVTAQDIVPEMAAVVVAHFTNLVPGSSGPKKS